MTNGYDLCRSCVGRNLANLELLVIVASIFRRYEFVLEDPAVEVRFPWCHMYVEWRALC